MATNVYSRENTLYKAIGGIMQNPQGAYDEMKKYFDMPEFKTQQDIYDYIKQLEKGRETIGQSSVATPGFNPYAETKTTNPFSASEIVDDSFKQYENSPAAGVTSYLGEKLQNISFVVLGVVIVAVALVVASKKDVIAVVKDAVK